jgi:hypothetical protein
MTLRKIVDDIVDRMGSALASRGLTAVSVEAKRPKVDNHMIEFRDAVGRPLNLRVQVDPRAPIWERCCVTIDRIERAALGNTGFLFEGAVGTRIRSLRIDASGTATADLLAKLEDSLVTVCPLDSLESRTLTDYRFVEVVNLLERLGDARGDNYRIAFEARGAATTPNTAAFVTDGCYHAEVVLGVSDDFVDVSYWSGDGRDFYEWSASSLAQFSRAMGDDIGAINAQKQAAIPQFAVAM